MNAGQIKAWFEQNKTVALGAAGAGVVGLALHQRGKKGDSGAGGAAVAAAASGMPAGAVPAVGALPSVGGYSAAADLSNALAPTLDKILQQQQRMTDATSGITAAAPPIASQLFAPNATGNYVRQDNGLIAEVQSDGSMLGLSLPQWVKILNDSGGRAVATDVGTVKAPVYSVGGNLQAANTKA